MHKVVGCGLESEGTFFQNPVRIPFFQKLLDTCTLKEWTIYLCPPLFGDYYTIDHAIMQQLSIIFYI